MGSNLVDRQNNEGVLGYSIGLHRRSPVTIAVGVKRPDGVVLGSDSQSEYQRGVDVKRLNATKICGFEDRYLFAGSGLMSQIQILIDAVCSALKTQAQQQRSRLNREESEITAESALLALVKHYNVDRSAILGIQAPDYFDPQVIFAGVDLESGCYLDLLHGNVGLVEPMTDYVAIGSGAAYAELLFKSLFSQDINLQQAITIVTYVIGEVIAIDPHCGGNIQISTITCNEGTEPVFNCIPSDTITATLFNAKLSLDLLRTHLVPKILRGELSVEKIKDITKDC